MHVRINQASFNREKKRMDALLKQVSQNAYIVTKASAEQYAELVRSGIAVKNPPSFAPNWAPLSEMWKATKTAHREEFWAETLGIFRAVRVKIFAKTITLIHIFSGIRQETDSGAFERAARNEYGFGLGPARPLFEPAKDFMAPMTAAGRRLKDRYKFIQALRSAIRRVYK